MKKKLLFPILQIVLLLAMLAGCTNASHDGIDKIQQRGTLLVGSTGDYRPLSYLEPSTNEYWGFDVELAEIIAKDLGVKIQFV
ncbi:MAG: transporter substrate-binding domain-containing protein, partial [Bacteroidales bacterium]|nr:transporter substrate-binding domain-containing protein [Bacteroidales bacterium]